MHKSQIWNFDGAKRRFISKHYNPPHRTEPISMDDYKINTCREICIQHDLIVIDFTGGNKG